MAMEIVKYVDGIKKVLQEQGFYYSYHADLTKSLQRSSTDKRYQWNEAISQDFTFQNVQPFWTPVPIIQGYIEQKTRVFGDTSLEIMLISRRRTSMAGARFISRGIDDNSNVANYVETEIIIAYDRHLYSFLQIRGSIPLFWDQKQKGLNNIISIKRNEELTSHVLDGHVADIVNDY